MQDIAVTLSTENTSNPTTNLVNSTDTNTLAREAFSLAIEQINNDKRVIISVEDDSLLESFLTENMKAISPLNIANFNSGKFISLENILNNKNAEQYNKEIDNYIHVRNHVYKSYLYDKISTQNKILSADLIGSVQYHEIHELVSNLEKRLKNSIPLISTENNFNFHVDELVFYKNILKEIKEIYQFSFDHNLELKHINFNNWKENEEKLVVKVNEYLHEFRQILEEYHIMSSIQIDNFRKSKNEEIDAKKELLDDLKLSLKIIDQLPVIAKKSGLIKNVFKSVDIVDHRKIATDLLGAKLKEISKNGWLEIELNNKNFDIIATTEKAITSLTLLIKFEENELDRNIANSVKSQNTLNVNNNLILLWSDSIKSTIEKLNHDKIFTKHLSINTFSISKKKEEVEKILNRLKILQEELIINCDFFEYNNLLMECNSNFLSVFDQIKKLDKSEWMEAFQLYYFKSLLKHFKVMQTNQFKNLVTEYYTINQAFEDNTNEIVYDSLIKKCKNGLQSIKQKDKSFYKKLVSETYQNQVRYEDLLTSFPDLSWQIFPLIIKKEFEDFYFNNKIDHIIYLGNPTRKSTINNTVFQKIENKNEDILIDYDVLNNTINLEDLSVTQRLEFSRNMAQIIVNFESNLRFFQLKNANIIAVIPDSWNDQIMDKLEQFGIKEFTIENKNENTNYLMLVESFMVTDRQQYFLCKDQFINSINDDYYLQLKALKCIENSGINTISLNTLSIENDINQLLEKITKNNFSLIESKSNHPVEKVDTNQIIQ